MRRLLAWNVVTLDGFFEGATPWDLSFHTSVWGDELEALSIEQLRDAGLLLFGRKTYDGMAPYWSAEAESEAGDIVHGMNSIAKAVASRSLESAEWNNTRVLRGDAVEAVRALKAEEGGNIYVFGSAELLASLQPHDLIDEYRICIAPVVLGGGTPLFKPGAGRLDLDLLEARPLRTGGTLLRYGRKSGA